MIRIAVFALISAFSFQLSAFTNPLPNECAIVATEAHARFQSAGVWSRILFITFLPPSGILGGHALTIYEPAKGARLLCYDAKGTLELGITSRDIHDVHRAVAAHTDLLVISAHWVTP